MTAMHSNVRVVRMALFLLALGAVLGLLVSLAGCGGAAEVASRVVQDSRRPEPAPDGEVRTTVTRVVDGDTVEVAAFGDANIRVLGIDAPETYGENECWGTEAAAAARERLLGERVVLRSDPQQGDTGAFDRRLRYVILLDPPRGVGEGLQTSVNFSIWSVARGHSRYAEEYPVAITPKLIVAEARAREAQRGLWGSPCFGRTELPSGG